MLARSRSARLRDIDAEPNGLCTFDRSKLLQASLYISLCFILQSPGAALCSSCFSSIARGADRRRGSLDDTSSFNEHLAAPRDSSATRADTRYRELNFTRGTRALACALERSSDDSGFEICSISLFCVCETKRKDSAMDEQMRDRSQGKDDSEAITRHRQLRFTFRFVVYFS